MDETTPLLLQDHSHSLPHRRRLTIFPALALIQFISFLDRTAISTSLPAIASGLDTGASISLVGGASFLITSTSLQLINGRLSDIFGRKASLVTALTIMGLGNLLSGFATSPSQLFAARALTGFGASAINALVQIALADITTLQQCCSYFGMIGLAVALGNGLGPVVGGIPAQTAGLPWVFWFVCPLCVLAVCYLVAVWPSSHLAASPYSSSSSSFSPFSSLHRVWNKLKLVDWIGAWTSFFGIALFLISISQGGSTVPWTSPRTICMLLAGLSLIGLFIAIEWRFAKLPLLPARLFIIPLYLQNVYGSSPAGAGILMLPMVISHGLTSAGTGVLISRLGHYKPVIVTGAVCWALAAIEKMHFDHTTPLWKIVVVGVFDGIGVGYPLQPVLVGLFAGSDAEDRAVLIGLRNFMRNMGGATSTTGVHMLSRQLSSRFGSDLVAKLRSSAFALKNLDLTAEEISIITQAYMKGLQAVFASFAALIAIHLCACACTRDYGLKQELGKKRLGCMNGESLGRAERLGRP
ncbi:putative efflux pump antibiotic resistance protein [Xylariaceae sp. FL1272]|nr:putative efflux pump antibiotic resistance protein [Xylariaceae sp. FL1272]